MMKPTLPPGCYFLCFAALLFGTLRASAVEPIVEQWRAVEIPFTSIRPHANPFDDVDVVVTFTGPGQTVLSRPAFWDGTNSWKVRFAPTKAGAWAYATACSDTADTGLHGQKGCVTCVPYAGTLEIYRRGFLRVSASQRSLAYRDGTPFFWLADTHWLWEAERLDQANKPGWTSQFKGMADKRAAQGFTVYQVELFGRWKKNGQPNIEHFQKNVDPKWAYLAAKGFVVAATLGILDKKVTKEQGLREAKMARYVSARYGAYPSTWLMYQECTATVDILNTNRDIYMNAVRGVGHAYKASDAYQHPRTAHSDASIDTSYRGEDWLDYTMFQGGHGKTIDRSSYYDYFFDTNATIPMVEGEANYEHLFEGSKANKAYLITTDDTREKAYQAMQSGCFGYTYAANGVWQAIWEAEKKGADPTYGTTPWFTGIDLPGADQMTHLAHYYAALGWPDLLPRPECDGFIRCDGNLKSREKPALTADAAVNRVSVYFYRGEPHSGTLFNLQNAPYAARWFDPRNGRYFAAGEILPDKGMWQFPAKPDVQDWLLVLTAKKPAPVAEPIAFKWDSERDSKRSRNLALKAKVSASSTDIGTKCYAPEKAIDGRVDVLNWSHWSNDGAKPASAAKPSWLLLEWGAPVKIKRVVIYTKAEYETSDYAIEWRENGKWSVFAEVTGNTSDEREHIAANPVSADAVRFLGKKGPARQTGTVRVVELEVFSE